VKRGFFPFGKQQRKRKKVEEKGVKENTFPAGGEKKSSGLAKIKIGGRFKKEVGKS